MHRLHNLRVWTLQDLRVAIGRLQRKKSPDQRGVPAALRVPEKENDGFASDIQFCVGGWGSNRLLADNLSPHVAAKIACYACK